MLAFSTTLASSEKNRQIRAVGRLVTNVTVRRSFWSARRREPANEQKLELAACKTLANSNTVEAPAAGGSLLIDYKYARQFLTSAGQGASDSGHGEARAGLQKPSPSSATQNTKEPCRRRHPATSSRAPAHPARSRPAARKQEREAAASRGCWDGTRRGGSPSSSTATRTTRARPMNENHYGGTSSRRARIRSSRRRRPTRPKRRSRPGPRGPGAPP